MVLVEGEVLHYFQNSPEDLVDFNSLEEVPKPGKVNTHPGEEVLIARGLLEYGLCIALRLDQLIHIGSEPLLNGLFGVGKGKTLEDKLSAYFGLEILRLIMTLTASNELLR